MTASLMLCDDELSKRVQLWGEFPIRVLHSLFILKKKRMNLSVILKII